MSLLEPLRRRSRRSVLLHDGQGPLLTGDCLDRVQALAERLRCRTDRPICVVSQLDNSRAGLLLELSVRWLGGVHVAVPPYFTAAQCRHVIEDCRPDWVLLPESADPGLASAQGAVCDAVPGLRLWSLPDTGRAPSWPAGTACITYTSGSTAAAKGVCLSESTLSAVVSVLAAAFAELAPRRHLCALPLATLLETVACYAALHQGAQIALPSLAELGYSGASGLQAERLHRSLLRYAPDSLVLVPQLLDGLLDALECYGPLPVPPRLVAVGGARVGEARLARAAALGLPVFEGYGLSEAGSVVCLNRPGARRPGSVGRPLPHVQLRIAADGEIWLRGATMLGYLGATPDHDDELATGDLGWIDSDGYVHLHGRKRNVFISSYGRNMSPEWIEAELAGSAIAQAVVVGEARPWNLALLAAADPQTTDLTLQAAVDAANRRLPDYARIAAFWRMTRPFGVADGSATGNGRIRRDVVLQRHAAAIERGYRQLATPTTNSICLGVIE